MLFRSAYTGSMAPPKYGTNMTGNISYYLGQCYNINLDLNRKFFLNAGAPAVAPVVPKQPKGDNSITVYQLQLQPYTISANFPAVLTTQLSNQVYQMKDIGNLDNRIGNLEQETALNLLELNAQSLQIRDNLDSTLERYKTGIFTDNFADASNAETGGDARFSIDFQNQTMQVRPTYNSVPLLEKTNYIASNYSSSELTYIQQARANNNYTITGQLLTLAYTTSTLLSQNIATTSVAVAPYLRSVWQGQLTVIPSQDIFQNVTVQSVVVGTSSNLTAAGMAQALADWYAAGNWWPWVYYGVTTVNVLQSTTQTSTLIPFARANTLVWKAQGLKPNAKHYPFFDGVPVGPFMTGAVKFTFDSTPILDTTTIRSDGTTNQARWRDRKSTRLNSSH